MSDRPPPTPVSLRDLKLLNARRAPLAILREKLA
jgi:hypothetical protein